MYKTYTYDDPEQKPSLYVELEENEVFTPGYDKGVFKQVGNKKKKPDDPPKGTDPDLFNETKSTLSNNNGNKLKENPYWNKGRLFHYIDYFDLDGKWLGLNISSTVNSDKSKIVFSKDIEKKIKKSTRNSNYAEFDPSESFYIADVYSKTEIDAMDQTFTDMETSGMEEGFAVGVKDNLKLTGKADHVNNDHITPLSGYNKLRKKGVTEGNLMYDVHSHPAQIKYLADGSLHVSGYKASQPNGDGSSDLEHESGKQPHIVLGYDIENNVDQITEQEKKNAKANVGNWTPINPNNFTKKISFYKQGSRLGSYNYYTFKANMVTIWNTNVNKIRKRNKKF